jgi:hypothetical protein
MQKAERLSSPPFDLNNPGDDLLVTVCGTLKGSRAPALWLRRAKPASANAIGFPAATNAKGGEAFLSAFDLNNPGDDLLVTVGGTLKGSRAPRALAPAG